MNERPKKSSTVPPTSKTTPADRYVATLREVADYWGVSYNAVERLAKGRSPVGKLAKAECGWSLDDAARMLLRRPAKSEAESETAEKFSAARASREQARAILEEYRAKRVAGTLVDAEEAKALRIRIIMGFVAIIETAPAELAGATSEAMAAWFDKQRVALVRSLDDDEPPAKKRPVKQKRTKKQ